MSATQEATESIPVHQMPLVKTELREVHRLLSPEERVEKDHDMHRLKREILEEEESLKSYTKERKGAIAKLETERDALIEVGEKGRSEWVDVEIRLDVEAGRRIVVQKESGEVVGHEPMQYSDRQPNLWPATLEDDAPTVPVSRQVRAAFLSTLGDKPGGGAVLKLHDDGLLDPPDFEIEEARKGLTEYGDEVYTPKADELRDWIAEAESDLDEFELEFTTIIDKEKPEEPDLITIAINSRTEGWKPTGDEAGKVDVPALIHFALRQIRDGRATIDWAHAQLMKTPAETVEHDDRSEQLEDKRGHQVEPVEAARRQVHRKRKAATADEVAIAETTEVRPKVPVHELRTIAPEERTGRWDVPAYWTAHDAGMLDPSEDDLRRARVDVDPHDIGKASCPGDGEYLDQLNVDCDAFEQDCASEIKTSAKARMAITRGSWPTKVAKVDDAIAMVRVARARLSVALDLEAEASA